MLFCVCCIDIRLLSNQISSSPPLYYGLIFNVLLSLLFLVVYPHAFTSCFYFVRIGHYESVHS